MWEETWKNHLKKILDNGYMVEKNTAKGNFKELIAHQFTLDNPRDRLIIDNKRSMNIFQCIGQFLWITQGNFSVADIAYYQPAARKYSSDGITMIGAYGLRLFGIHHLNQMNYLLEVLGEDPTKRKAVASVYLPQFDQHNKKNEEVPCTLNLQYLVRDKKVHAVTYMRSQDAYNILPYDLFIFTMLQEYVTAYLGGQYNVELWEYHHFSGSFHTYERDEDAIRKVIANPAKCTPMGKMPPDDVYLELGRINDFEMVLRNAVSFHTKKEIFLDLDVYEKALEGYADHPYWKQIGIILLCYGAWKVKNLGDYERFMNKLTPVYHHHVKQFLITHPIIP